MHACLFFLAVLSVCLSVGISRVQLLAKVVVSADDVALVARELLLSTADAETLLKKNAGDVQSCLKAFVLA